MIFKAKSKTKSRISRLFLIKTLNLRGDCAII